jgi:hypothetical protein
MKKHLLFLLLFPLSISAQQPDLDSLDTFIAQQVKDYKVPGLAIGIIKANKFESENCPIFGTVSI